MPPTTAGFIIPKDIKIWAECIGGFVINCGSSELLAMTWIEKNVSRKAALKSLKKLFPKEFRPSKKLFQAQAFLN